MAQDEWRARLEDPESWRHLFGSRQSPVIVAALDPRTAGICANVRDLLAGRPLRLFVLGPPGSGKSLLLAALIAEAGERGVPVQTLSANSDTAAVLRDLARGQIGLLAVNRLDELSQTARASVLNNRMRCAVGVLATAEQLSVASLSALVEQADDVVRIPPLEGREADILVISQLLWPELCGDNSNLLGNCLDEAKDNLCKGPYPNGVSSLRICLAQLADSLIASGALQGGEFRRQVDARDIVEALLAGYRAQSPASQTTPAAVVIVVEGATDVTYLTAAAGVADKAWGWSLLDGCELRAAGDDRSGGANAVWRRLIAFTATSVECVGLFDNDDVGRREYATARGQGLQVELLPPEFDRLHLANEHRVLEVEDLLSLRVLDRFYKTHSDLTPEEIRWRNRGWRIVPHGNDKEVLAEWAAEEMQVLDCERLIYVLCALRKRLGLPVPRDDLEQWRTKLSHETPEKVGGVIARLSDRG